MLLKQNDFLKLAFAYFFAFQALWIAPAGAASQGLTLPAAGTRVPLSEMFEPSVLQGLKVHANNPYQVEFIMAQGKESAVQSELPLLIKYFLAGLTIPEQDLWVNLSPYEQHRIIPDAFGTTEMGRDLLAQDYMLKQITASLMYPEGETGKEFWKTVYAQAAQAGLTHVPVRTFHKVWIMPEKAGVYERTWDGKAAGFIIESTLKVMLEEDYRAESKNPHVPKPSQMSAQESDALRSIILPALTKDINTGRNFARLRQIYHSLVLAAWYKKKIKQGILAQMYNDKQKTAGLGYGESGTAGTQPLTVEDIYQRYVHAFKKGVYNYIKDEPDAVTNTMVPRKYFSGGAQFQLDQAMYTTSDPHKIPRTSGYAVAPIRLAPYSEDSGLKNNAPEFSNEGIDPDISAADLKKINDAREDLYRAALAMRDQLPPGSTWQKNWMKAAIIPVREVVRDPKHNYKGVISQPFQVRYYINQHLVRKEILKFLFEMISNDASEKSIDTDRYKKFLNDAHRILMGGEDGSNYYLGFAKSAVAESNGYKHWEESPREIKRKIQSGEYDLSDRFINEKLQGSALALNEIFKTDYTGKMDIFLDDLYKYYRWNMPAVAPGLAFGGGNANNSFFMNIVNALAALVGLQGVSHANFDLKYAAPNSEENFNKAFRLANPDVFPAHSTTASQAMTSQLPEFSDEGIAPGVIGNSALMDKIVKAREDLYREALKMRDNLPQDSPWRAMWMNAAIIPVREVVRNPRDPQTGSISSPFQAAYYVNQHAVRKMFLAFLSEMLNAQARGEDFYFNDYKKFLNDAHRTLLLGEDGNSLYVGFSKSYGYYSLFKYPGEDKPDIIRIKELIDNGDYDLKNDFLKNNLASSLDNLKVLLKWGHSGDLRGWLRQLHVFYRTGVPENDLSLAFGSFAANNSFFMNLVNALIRLRFSQGISHGEHDANSAANGAVNFFVDDILAGNSDNAMITGALPVFSNEGIDRDVLNNKAAMNEIARAREDLYTAALALRDQLPPDSYWRRFWMNAAIIPVSEVVRDPQKAKSGRITLPFQVRYYVNQHGVRKHFLEFLVRMINQKSDSPRINDADYKDFLNAAHRILLMGEDQNSVYFGYGSSRVVFLNNSDYKDRDVIWVKSRVTNGDGDLSDAYVKKYLSLSLAELENLLKMGQSGISEDWLFKLHDFYRLNIPEIDPGLAFGSGGANNSFFMNFINALLALMGLKGIPHGHHDTTPDIEGARNLFVDAILAMNPGFQDHAMIGRDDGRPVFSDEGIDPALSVEYRDKIDRARKDLYWAAYDLREKLPKGSPWRRHWMNAAVIPVREVVRNPDDPLYGRISHPIQVRYYVNQHAVRKRFLSFLADVLSEQPPGNPVNREKYKEFLNRAHRILLLGEFKDSIYFGFNNSSDYYSGDGDRDYSEDRVKGIIEWTEDEEYDLRSEFIRENLQMSLGNLERLLNMDDQEISNEWLSQLYIFYRTNVPAGSPGSAFGPGAANNSFFMNFVNGFLRLKGAKGIAHSVHDKNLKIDAINDFIKDVFKENPALVERASRAMTSESIMNGGIDLTSYERTMIEMGEISLVMPIIPGDLARWRKAPGVRFDILGLTPVSNPRVFLELPNG